MEYSSNLQSHSALYFIKALKRKESWGTLEEPWLKAIECNREHTGMIEKLFLYKE